MFPVQTLVLHDLLQIVQRLLSHLHDLAPCPFLKFGSQRLGHSVITGGQQNDLVKQDRGQFVGNVIHDGSVYSILFRQLMKKKKPTSTCFSCSMWIADVFLVLLDRALIPSAKHAETLQNSRRTTLPGYPYLIEEAQIKWEKGVDSWLKADWEAVLTWEPSVLQQASRCLHLCPHWTPAASHSRSTYRPREVKMQGWEKYAVTWMKDGVVSCTGTWGTVLPHYLQLSRLNEIFCGEVKRAILTQLSGPVLTPRPVGWVQIYSLSFFIS